MPWQVLMLLQNTGSAVFAIFSREIAKKYKNVAWQFNVIVFAVIASSGLLYVAAERFQNFNPSDFIRYAPLFILAGLCFAFTNVASYKVFEYVDAAIASLLATLNVVAAVILATLAIHEGLTDRQLLGGVILFAGIYIMLSIDVTRHKHQQLMKALVLSLIASLFFAMATTTEKYLINRVTLPTYLVFGWGFQFLGVLGAAYVILRKRKDSLKIYKKAKFVKWSLGAGFIRMVSGAFFILALKLANNLSIISVLSGFKVVLVALFGALFLKEQQFMPRKLFASVLAMVGIAVLLWR